MVIAHQVLHHNDGVGAARAAAAGLPPHLHRRRRCPRPHFRLPLVSRPHDIGQSRIRQSRIRQSQPDSGLDSQETVLTTFGVVLCLLLAYLRITIGDVAFHVRISDYHLQASPKTPFQTISSPRIPVSTPKRRFKPPRGRLKTPKSRFETFECASCFAARLPPHHHRRCRIPRPYFRLPLVSPPKTTV